HDITFYPSSVLGQDTAMMSQAIAGALEIYGMSFDILAQKAPPAAIFGVGFAFPITTWHGRRWTAIWALLPRPVREGRPLLHGQGVRSRIPRNHDEVQTDQHARRPQRRQDPPAGRTLVHSVVPASRRVADPDQFRRGLQCTANRLVDGQENPLILIDTAKLYEVQKYCSMTNHIWVGLHISFNTEAWKRLPADLQAMAYKHFSAAAMAERADWQVMDKSEIEKMSKAGLVFSTPDTKPFREALRKSGFYPDVKKQMGDEA